MLPTPEQAWNDCLGRIRKSIAVTSFDTWFRPIRPVALNRVDGEIRLTVEMSNRFVYDYFEQNYSELVTETVEEVLGPDARLHYRVIIVPKESAADPNAAARREKPLLPFRPSQPKTPKLPPVNSNLNEDYTFDRFIEGDCNKLARSAGLAIADNPGNTPFNPLFVYGNVGLGKTHLIQAVGNSIVARYPEKRVLYISSEGFTNDFIDAIKNNRPGQFSKFYRSIDVLIIDDVQFFGEKEKTQEEFFHVFNELHQARRQIILSADRPPKDIKGIEERLLSRFQWGLAADMQVPELETRMAILQAMACRDGWMELPLEVVEFMAHNITSNVRELTGALIRLMAIASFTNGVMDLSTARKALQTYVTERPASLSVDMILENVCRHFGVTLNQVRARTRKSEIVRARHVAMYFSKEFTQCSLKTIGLQFGGRDHSTVIHAINSVQNQLDTDTQFKDHLDQIRRSLNISLA